MHKQVTRSRFFQRGRALAHLEAQDRYLGPTEEPEFAYGFIGCGMMGQEHMRNTLLAGRATIGGVFDACSRSVKHALAGVSDAFGTKAPTVYSSLEEACADPHTDALIIATPNHTHLDVFRVAAGSGKALFLEKPIATSAADAYEVCQLAADHPRPVRFGLQYRFKAIYADAITEVMTNGAVGRVHSINMVEHRFPFLDKVDQWNKFDASTGGTLVEKCCHYFDLMNLFAGAAPESVHAIGSQAVNFKDFARGGEPADGLDQAHVTMAYPDDVIGAFSLAMYAPGAHEALIICGDTGRLHATEQAEFGAEAQSSLELWSGESGVSRTVSPRYPSYIRRAGHHGSTFFEHLDFAEQLSGRTSFGPSLADGFWSVAVGVAAQKSIRERAVVDVADVLPEGFDRARIEHMSSAG